MRTAQVAESWERLLDRGVSDRCTGELLAVVLGGAGVERQLLDPLARGIDSGRFARAAAMPDELSAGYELQSSAAWALMAAFELARRAAVPDSPHVVRGAADVAAIARREVGGRRRETVLAIVCDAVNRPLRTVVVADGALDRSPMPVREILNAVLRWDGRAFAIAHNHPSGDPEPSEADIAATRRIADAARVVGLRFLGHVVVGDGRWADVAT